jgi:uncharacterized repeat protein (TIGR03803 family)
MACIVVAVCAATAIRSPAQTLTTLHSFTGSDGSSAWAGLVQGYDGNFYGTTYSGGAYGYGTVFKITPAGTLTLLHSFAGADGSGPGALMQAIDGNFYGTTYGGGASGSCTKGCGTVFKITAAGALTTLHSFSGSDGAYPFAGLVQATDGNFYGTAGYGGTHGSGTVFKITPAGALTTLHSFNSTDGWGPFGGVVQATDGSFYGTTYGGGAYTHGTVFKITPAGTLTTLHSFNSTDGSTPWAGLVQAADGNFYGTTYNGGAYNYGTIFKITSAGTLTTLHSFNSTDGSYPYAGLMQATDGNFYGTTFVGGAYNYGTIFQITPAGTLTTLHSFDSTDGWGPEAVVLVQGIDGNLYGTTDGGGAYNAGTVFQLSVGLQPVTTLHSFARSDGSEPQAGLVQATDGNFYGTTVFGGAYSYGSVFKITPAGTLATLHSFAGTDGSGPLAELVQATDGNFYGTAEQGGFYANCTDGCGTIFKITAAGTLTTLHSFAGTDGSGPYAGLVQATDGNFYGTTAYGGTSGACGLTGCGTIFKLSVGLGPFVETRPTSGKVGAAVIILVTNLTGATSVRFNGTAAKFTVVSSSEIKTTVPTGATTGSVTVVTPSGTLKGNVVFRVTPQIKGFAPTSGAVGTVVTITGVSLKQTKTVTFGGVKATSITVVSDTEVEATVPTGAKTGHIAITTSGGTATSSGTFTVT